MVDLFYCTLDIQLRARVVLDGEHVRGGSTLGCQMAVESEWGSRDRSVLSPMGEFTWIDNYIARHYLNWATWMPLRPPACQNQPSFGLTVMNCL